MKNSNGAESGYSITAHGMGMISTVTEKMGQKHWSAIFTYRGEAVRIISVRRARKEEVDAYES